MTSLTKRKASKACPHRLTWFAIGAASITGVVAAYILLYSGILGVPRGPRQPPPPQPLPQPESPAS